MSRAEQVRVYIEHLERVYREYEAALRKIVAIENKMNGPDWEEIDEARAIANAALAKAGK
jgi:hypothetical protein